MGIFWLFLMPIWTQNFNCYLHIKLTLCLDVIFERRSLKRSISSHKKLHPDDRAAIYMGPRCTRFQSQNPREGAKMRINLISLNCWKLICGSCANDKKQFLETQHARRRETSCRKICNINVVVPTPFSSSPSLLRLSLDSRLFDARVIAWLARRRKKKSHGNNCFSGYDIYFRTWI